MEEALQRSKPLYEQLYQKLKSQIMNGSISAGERLIDSRLSEKFGISRSPIREALRMLENEGLLVNRKGVLRVYEPSLNDLIELYKVRSGLEYSAVFWGTRNQSDEMMDKLYSCLQKAEEALKVNDFETVIEQNTFFHDTILTASENKRLISIMEDIRSLILLYRNILFLDFKKDYDFMGDHLKVYKLIKNKEPENAAQMMVEHINNDMEHFKKISKQRGLK